MSAIPKDFRPSGKEKFRKKSTHSVDDLDKILKGAAPAERKMLTKR
jgi:hypothetical protein